MAYICSVIVILSVINTTRSSPGFHMIQGITIFIHIHFLIELICEGSLRLGISSDLDNSQILTGIFISHASVQGRSQVSSPVHLHRLRVQPNGLGTYGFQHHCLLSNPS